MLGVETIGTGIAELRKFVNAIFTGWNNNQLSNIERSIANIIASIEHFNNKNFNKNITIVVSETFTQRKMKQQRQ